MSICGKIATFAKPQNVNRPCFNTLNKKLSKKFFKLLSPQIDNKQ
jgi:hypothetical protein